MTVKELMEKLATMRPDAIVEVPTMEYDPSMATVISVEESPNMLAGKIVEGFTVEIRSN